MARAPFDPVLRFLQAVAVPAPSGNQTDGALLARFVAAGDEGAFAALVGWPATYTHLPVAAFAPEWARGVQGGTSIPVADRDRSPAPPSWNCRQPRAPARRAAPRCPSW